MFKTSVKGFKKSDVNNYIITMHREFADEKEALLDELDTVRTALLDAKILLLSKDALIDVLNDKIREGEALLEENERLKAENKKLTDESAELTTKISLLTICAEKAEQKAAEAEAKLRDIQETLFQPEERSRESKPKVESKVHFNIPDTTPPASGSKKDRNSILSKFKKVFT